MNRLTTIPNITPLRRLDILNLTGNTLEYLKGDALSPLTVYSKLYVTQHEICQCYVVNASCSASGSRSPYLTCDRLLSDRVLVVALWFIAISALGGNLFVLIWPMKYPQRNKVQHILLINLAISDALYGRVHDIDRWS